MHKTGVAKDRGHYRGLFLLNPYQTSPLPSLLRFELRSIYLEDRVATGTYACRPAGARGVASFHE
jgi:hypothetical protein